jgi:response regulator NasT
MAEEPSQHPDSPLPLPKRVVVADDEHLVATGLVQALCSFGIFTIGPVADADSAIELAIKERADLAVLDIRLNTPKDGLSAAAELWHEHNIPTVIVSAYAETGYVQRAIESGVFGYLLKPISTESLRVTISVAWAWATSHDGQSARISQLERTLESRKVVEQAKWKLIQSRGMTEPEAHNWLRDAARQSRRRLADVAADVLDGSADPRPANGSA